MKINPYAFPFFIQAACSAQEHQEEKHIYAGAAGGSFEGCQVVYEWGDKPLQGVDTMPILNAGPEANK